MSRAMLTALGAAALLASLACEKKLDEAQIRAKIQAEEAAKAADDRVARLEKELADLKAGKADPKEADKEGLAQAKADHQKALERQLAEQKRKAEARKQEALKLAEAKTAPPAPSPKAEAPKPVVVEVPAGTSLAVNLASALSTEQQKAGDLWQGTLAEPVAVGGQTVWAAGTPVRGVVAQSVPAGRLASGKGALGIRLTEVGDNDVEGGDYVVTGDAKGERNAKIIGGAAALGALVGILSDKKNKGDHALGGAAIGAAAGTAAAAATAKTTIVIPADRAVTFTLAAPEKVTIRKP
ncbi:MAG: hypothetical protein U0P81_04595 [Holophagaceae bacterium]